MIDPMEGGRGGQTQQEEPGTDSGTSNQTDTSTTTQEPGPGHKSKTTSYKFGVFFERVESETATPPSYPKPPPE